MYWSHPSEYKNVPLFWGWMMVKKSNKDFNVSKGSYDSAEIYELDGQFLLSEMEKFIPKKQLRRRTFHGWPPLPLSIDRLRKQIVKVFNAEHCLKITVELNKRSTDFLDVIFDLVHISLTEKMSAPPLHLHKQWIKPPIIRQIKKEFPKLIDRRELLSLALRLSWKKIMKTYGFQVEIQRNTSSSGENWILVRIRDKTLPPKSIYFFEKGDFDDFCWKSLKIQPVSAKNHIPPLNFSIYPLILLIDP